MKTNAEFDVIIYGASGYTGRLVAEYMQKQYGAGGDVKWAMAGRSEEKLASVRAEMGVSEDVPLVVADASDPEQVKAMAERAKCICTTVGPYQLYGEPLVAACAETGTDYVDLCGEPGWMHNMINAHESKAMETGARIVFSCGFDSIPFDLGVQFLQETATQKLGGPVPRAKGRMRAMEGKFSGGTAASLGATMAALKEDPSLLQVLANPFSLTGGFQGPEQPAGNTPEYDDDLGSWAAPFVMAPINTKNVHRSNALMNHAYGQDFVYDEMMLTGSGEQGEQAAKFIASADLIGGENAPKPGEGPTKEERENGHYDALFVGYASDGGKVAVSVKGDKDPGYGSTSKMIAEAALCIANDCPETPGGIYTTAPAMGAKLRERLIANAGLTFTVEG